MSTTQQQLAEAFDLIKKDRLDEAIRIIRPITQSEPDNADAWWLLANASSEPRDARQYLVNVLKINPAYPKARDLLDMLNEQYPPRDDELRMLLEVEDVIAEPPSQAESFDDAVESDDDLFAEFATDSEKSTGSSEIDELFSGAPSSDDPFADRTGMATDDDPFAVLLEEDGQKKAQARSGNRRRVLLLAPLILLLGVLVCGGAFLVLGSGDDDSADESTAQQAVISTLDAESLDETMGANVGAVLAAIEQDFDEWLNIPATSQALQVPSGDTALLMVDLCSVPGPQLREVAIAGMSLTAWRLGNTMGMETVFSQMGITIVDCDNPEDMLYRAVVSTEAALEFSTAVSTPQQALRADQAAPDAFGTYRATWQVVQ